MIDYLLDHLILFIIVSRMPTVARAMLAIGSVLVSVKVGKSGLAAGNLNFSLPVSTSSQRSLSDSVIEFLDPKNMGLQKVHL